MSENKWSEDEVKLYEALQEKYKGNDLFARLEDVQLAICGVMDELGRGDYEIIRKGEKQELIKKFIDDDIDPFLELYKISPNSEEFIYWKKRKEKWQKREEEI